MKNDLFKLIVSLHWSGTLLIIKCMTILCYKFEVVTLAQNIICIYTLSISETIKFQIIYLNV